MAYCTVLIADFEIRITIIYRCHYEKELLHEQLLE